MSLHPRSLLRSIASALVVAVGLSLAGCSNDPNPAPYRETRADGSPWRVKYATLPGDPKSFDPQHAYDSISQRVLEPVYDRLLEHHPMKTDPIELQPGMLEEVPKKEAHADGTVSYLCRLKKGIMYHDDPCFPGGKGREVVAEDVHFVLQRLCDPKVESPFFAPIAQNLIGMKEAREAAAQSGKFDYSGRIPGFETIDKHTFRLRLSAPYPALLWWMAMNVMSPVAKESVEYYDGEVHGGDRRPNFRSHSVGTGPFRIRDYTARREVRYESIDGYHTNVFPSDGFPPEKAEWLKQFAGKPLPLFDELRFLIIQETIPGFVLGRQGYLDGITANKDAFAAIMTSDLKLTPRFQERGMELELVGTPGTFFMSFNMQDPIIGKNVKLRKAISAAYDGRAYVKIFYSGVAPLANQLIPKGVFGYDPDYVNPNGYNLERAKELLAEAGYPGGRDATTGQPLELTIEEPVAGTEERQRAEYNKRLFEKLGIRIKVNENTFSRVLERLEQGNFQLGNGTGWMADYPDPENFLMLFYSKNFPREGANYCRYNNPEYDKAYEEMANMENGPERKAIIDRMNAMLAEDCPAVFQFDKAFFVATQPWARWTHNSPMIEGGFQKYHQVEPVLREKLRKDWNRRPTWPILLLCCLVGAGIVYAILWNRKANA